MLARGAVRDEDAWSMLLEPQENRVWVKSLHKHTNQTYSRVCCRTIWRSHCEKSLREPEGIETPRALSRGHRQGNRPVVLSPGPLPGREGGRERERERERSVGAATSRVRHRLRSASTDPRSGTRIWALEPRAAETDCEGRITDPSGSAILTLNFRVLKSCNAWSCLDEPVTWPLLS